VQNIVAPDYIIPDSGSLVELNYRTERGSAGCWIPPLVLIAGIQDHLFIEVAFRIRRIHHSSGAAPPGTPVRARFCKLAVSTTSNGLTPGN
jgi:hypothetical protein